MRNPRYIQLSRNLLIATSVIGLGWTLTSCDKQDALSNISGEQGQTRTPSKLTISSGEMSILGAFEKLGSEQKFLDEAKVKISKVMAKYLFDPESATYSDVRIGKNGGICGKYNAKNRYGAYVGYKDFVIDKDGNLETSSSNDGIESTSLSSFSSSYIALCATKEERSRYDQRNNFSNGPDYTEIEPDPEPESKPDVILDAPSKPDPPQMPDTY